MPSEDAVRARLDRLKGVPHIDEGGQQAHFYQPPESRTATELANHLMGATSAKVTIANQNRSELNDLSRLILRHAMLFSVLKRTLLDDWLG